MDEANTVAHLDRSRQSWNLNGLGIIDFLDSKVDTLPAGERSILKNDQTFLTPGRNRRVG